MLTIPKCDRDSMVIVKSVADLEAVPVTPRGARSGRWQGVRHADFVRAAASAVRSLGWEIDKTHAMLTRKGAGLVGSFDISPVDGRAPTAGRFPEHLLRTMRPSIGFRHANDSVHALNVYFGAVVKVCSNGLVSSCTTQGQRRKHTSGLDLSSWVRDAVGAAFRQGETLDVDVEAMHQAPLGVGPLNNALCGLARMGLMPWSLVGKVDREFAKPRHLDFADKNVWSWYNCVTEIAKEQAPDAQFKTLDSAWGLARALAQLN